MAGRHRFAALLGLAMLAVWAAAFALVLTYGALDDAAGGRVAALFPPGTPAEDMLAAVASADGLTVSGTWFDNVLVTEGAAPGFVGRLKTAGARAAYRTYGVDYVMLGGCFFSVPTRRTG